MALTYIKKYRVERIKLALNASQSKHGCPLPLSEVARIANEYGVQADWVRRIERRDIDTGEFEAYRKSMKKSGVDADAKAGDRVSIGGKATTKFKKKAIRETIIKMIDDGLEIDFASIYEEFGLNTRSTWPKIILSEIEKERAGGEKRPVSPAQRELVMDILRSVGANFGLPGQTTRHKESIEYLLDRYSMAQIHKAIKSLSYVQKTSKALSTDFARKVIWPLLNAVDFRLLK